MKFTCFLALCGLSSLAYAGPPLLTDDPDTPARGHWEINLAATAGKQAGNWALETPLLDVNYGFRDDIQLKFEMPYLVELHHHGSDPTGMGDAEVGVKWRFLDEDKAGVAVSAYPQFAWNTSRQTVRRGLIEDGCEFLLPLEISREVADGTTVFGEIGLSWLESQAPGTLCGLAVEHELGGKFSLLGEIHGESADAFAKEEWVCNVGFHWQTTEHAALIGSIGRGITHQDEPLQQALAYLGVQLTF